MFEISALAGGVEDAERPEAGRGGWGVLTGHSAFFLCVSASNGLPGYGGRC